MRSTMVPLTIVPHPSAMSGQRSDTDENRSLGESWQRWMQVKPEGLDDVLSQFRQRVGANGQQRITLCIRKNKGLSVEAIIYGGLRIDQQLVTE